MNNSTDKCLLKTYREMTDYPDVFYSYWGSHEEDKKLKWPEPKIIENRNKFAKEYDLEQNKRKQRVNTPPWIDAYLRKIKETDHIEAYKNKKGEYVIIFSGHNKPDDRFGFKEIYPLYALHQQTYCITLPHRKSRLTEKATVEINGQNVELNLFNQT